VKKHLLLLLSILLLQSSRAQVVAEHYESWNSVAKDIKINKIKLNFDVSLRFYGFPLHWRQQLYRGQIAYALSDHLQLGAGYAFSNQYPYSGAEAANEHRFHFVIQEDWKNGKISFRSRFRWEYQLMENLKDPEHRIPYHRPRYQYRMAIDLKNTKNQIILADEVLFQSHNFNCFGFDQNRVYLGFRRKFEKSRYIELAYMNILLDKKSGKYELNHVLWLTFGL